MAKKIRVGVIFGGRSAEHEVSLASAKSVMASLDKKKYEIIPIGITKEGKWIVGKPMKALTAGVLKNVSAVIPPTNPREKGLIKSKTEKKEVMIGPIDVLFPVLHGTYGEDGTMQGLLELAGIPYVGSGVLGSAVGMDKVVQKQLLNQAGIKTPKFTYFLYDEWTKHAKELKIETTKEIGFPCFVKPANLGSSVGISKVHNIKQLARAVNFAFEYDHKVIIEKSVEEAREIEISVLGNDDPQVSEPGEIIASNEFYDYDAKYVDGASQAIIPAKIPDKVTEKIKETAKAAFLVLNCAGFARADFLVTKKGYTVYLNELNTIPGFTDISMYPKLWEASGMNYSDLIEKLIKLALEKQTTKDRIKTSYKPKSKWYK